MKNKIILFLLFALLQTCAPDNDPLFHQIPSTQSGIHFSNAITFGDSLSVIDFEYMYNGGGVAVGDINNDGLQDIYFTGNMTSSRLYINKGNWKFEDITERAKVTTLTWASGAVMIDINQDGFKDIYISVGGNRNTPERERSNLLFINNGDLTFTEQAEKYGLNDRGYGIQSAFFDYDLDGDLDMYLLRNSFVSYSRNASRPKVVNGEAASNDKLFRNNGDLTFTDVTKEAGILIEGFGLGVTVSDFNNDGWPDIYVSNDFITNDLLWINNQDGTFTNQVSSYLKHQTFNSMGNDVADYNNDGLVDIAVVDMLPEDNKRWKLTPRGNGYDEFEHGLSIGYEPQYVRNTLQLNNGNGTFSEIGQLAGVEATEWSWSVLFADYDNDGLKDLFITNGYGKDITNLDFIMYGDEKQNMGLPVAEKEQRQALLNELPGIKIHNYIYKNKGDLTFSDESEAWGLTEPTFSNGAAYADLDNDGDLDLVVNNIDGEASLLENKADSKKDKTNYLRIALEGPEKNWEGFGTKVYLKTKETIQYQYFSPFRGYLSSVEPFLHFGLSQNEIIDSLEIIWPDGKYQLLTKVNSNQLIKVSYQDAGKRPETNTPLNTTLFTSAGNEIGIDFTHKENTFVDFKVQPSIPHMNSRYGPGIAVGDVNGDGLEDFYIGGAATRPGGLFLQNANGKFNRHHTSGIDSLAEDTGVLFFDADLDGDLDLYIVSGDTEQANGSPIYQDRFFTNDGKGNFSLARQALPNETVSGSCVVAADYDRDGDLDLFVGGRVNPGSYPMPVESFLLRNDSKNGIPKFTNITREIIPGINQSGMISGALWSDYDNDGWMDLVISGEFLPIQFYRNNKGKFEKPIAVANSLGWWNSLTAGDFDLDGDIDYIAGNLGLNSHFKAADNEPLCIHAKDFNNDGRIDPIMSYYTQGVNYIGHPRDVLIDQINSMRSRFRTFTAYADATFKQSFLPEELEDAYVVCCNNFESSYLENVGNGQFHMKALPIEAQFGPIYGMIAEDFDNDGNLDVLISGNSYAPEVLSGRDDALIGLLLKGDGKGNFTPIHNTKSGFVSDMDSKGMVKIIMANQQSLILVGNNSHETKSFLYQWTATYLKANTNDVSAVVTLLDGRKYRHEFQYGSTYLSNSSRTLKLSSKISAVSITDYQGNTRSIQLNK
ncbi:MAG: VCBS repeat-containing protein [Cyclobacteriaceae bacterium]|nr:VCBS repeat-containing protein [Cyclobacteriaceae bacterium]